MAPAQGLFCRYERDRYLFVFEERFLAQFQEGKFSILETVREVVSPSGIQATLSIGVGKDAETLAELFQYAALSVEMALSRGGDQVVVKNKFNFEFYGGRTKELEKQVSAAERAVAKAEERQYELTLKAEEVASNYLELQKVYDEQKALEEEIAALYTKWETLAAELEEARG